MKKIVLILFLLVSNLLVGQNLVPNPSFEDTVQCPTGNVSDAIGWSNFSNQSPDYFHSCNSGFLGVPNNFFGYQQAASGNAYCGLSTYFSPPDNGREIIGIALTNQLILGNKYYVSFKSNLSIDTFAVSGYATNNLGARFSTLSSNPAIPDTINNFSHVFHSTIITDTLNWTLIMGSFIADSNYNYIAIGNFFDNANTDTLKIMNGTPSVEFAYYFIDDVCVSTDSLTCYNFTTGVKEQEEQLKVNIYPNPTSTHFNIEGINQPYHLTIYNAVGQLLHQEHVNEYSKQVDVRQYAKGLLFIRIEIAGEVIYRKVIKK